jgi:hypothetical protein
MSGAAIRLLGLDVLGDEPEKPGELLFRHSWIARDVEVRAVRIRAPVVREDS